MSGQPSCCDPESESQRLLEMYRGDVAACVTFIRHHFDVLQARSQLLLTVGTLALTITGFSGPRIAESGPFARMSMAVGIVFVLGAMVMLLLGGLRIQWISQLLGDDARASLVRILEYRNRKTRLYFVELTLLVLGLASYVSSVVSYLLSASG